VVPAVTAWYGYRPQTTGQWDLSRMYWLTVTRWPAVASGSCVTGRNAGLRGRHSVAPSGLGAGRSWGLAQVAADTDLVTLQLRIATGGGHVLTAKEAAHHQ
jgi:hypothetical protein